MEYGAYVFFGIVADSEHQAELIIRDFLANLNLPEDIDGYEVEEIVEWD